MSAPLDEHPTDVAWRIRSERRPAEARYADPDARHACADTDRV
ncbi:MAG TPA: hypothetical protein PLS63_00495 [Microthrixaceae bacterium]|jgi:hypothetical protein|nr:hypothetical protein [Microthrixaceae bacterium]